MQLIKDKQILDNTWTWIADDQPLVDGDIAVSFARWQQDKDALKNRSGKTGVCLTSTDNPAELADDLAQICLIELDFPAFTDGRLFSTAKLLRDKYRYTGEIRAAGNYMLDQIGYLARCGVNAFQLNDESQLPLALSLIDEISVSYQS